MGEIGRLPTDKVKVFSGNANPRLAESIARELGVPLGRIEVDRFADGEVKVKIEESVRGRDVFVIQPICRSDKYSVNDNLMELLVMLDAFKRASANRVIVVAPYYAYARQDRKIKPREPISARLVADLITAAGADRIVTMDLHAQQIQGFFKIPVDNVPAGPAIAEYLEREGLKGESVVIVSPDVGGVARATKYADDLGSPLAIVVKRRPEPNEAEVMEVIGDVKGRTAVIVDDIIDTGKSVVEAAKALIERGATSVYACCTHPVLSGKALERVEDSPIERLVVTDTIPIPGDKKSSKKLVVLSVAPLLARAMECIYFNKSLSGEFAKYW